MENNSKLAKSLKKNQLRPENKLRMLENQYVVPIRVICGIVFYQAAC